MMILAKVGFSFTALHEAKDQILSDRILMMKTLYCYYSKEVVIIYRMIGLRAELA